jgi:hypothetical protein
VAAMQRKSTLIGVLPAYLHVEQGAGEYTILLEILEGRQVL